MTEDFLHYAWKFQKFSARGLKTVEGQSLRVIAVGQHNHDAGPDFFNAQLAIDGQLWAGNVEIHIKSSDWYAHHHEKDDAYDTVILHVVWEYDAAVFRKDETAIPTLVLKNIIAKDTLANYQKLFTTQQRWINCENDFPTIDSFVIENWLDRLYLERLQQKSEIILKELEASNHHWEEVLFRLLCKNVGLKVNGAAFFSIAKSVDFLVIKKCRQTSLDLEAVLVGQAGLLDRIDENAYFKKLQEKYEYLKHKFQLINETVITPKFFRLRPPNFPTIRLSQLAVLYASKQQLFSTLISMKKLEDFYEVFNVSASSYWDTHYNFGVSSSKRVKKFSKPFIDLLLINTVIPLKFCYAAYLGKDVSEEVIALASEIKSEENSIIKKYNELQPVAKTALHSQALLQLKNKYCDKNRCLQCAIGNTILKG